MYEITGPAGEPISIPADISEDKPYFATNQLKEASSYLKEHGYTVLRGLIPTEACDIAGSHVRNELAQYRSYLYRQTTANPEIHAFDLHGFIMNPVLNVQDVPSKELGGFRTAALDVLSSPSVQAFLVQHFGEQGNLVQSMYFQGNTATWAHQDTYYLDAEEIGTMIAGWFALEDIQPGAGRFFVYPGSHLVDVRKNGGDFDIAFNHERYKQLMVSLIKQTGLPCVAPALRKGDVLFWSAKTIHGSLMTKQPQYSRSSFTAHYIPKSARFLQFQARIKGLKLKPHNGMQINHPKSLDVPSKQAVLWLETTFPKSFQLVKKIAIKALTR